MVIYCSLNIIQCNYGNNKNMITTRVHSYLRVLFKNGKLFAKNNYHLFIDQERPLNMWTLHR